MPGEAIWLDKCPICEGTGQIESIIGSDRGKKVNGTIVQCEACKGTGKILMVQKIRKKNDK